MHLYRLKAVQNTLDELKTILTQHGFENGANGKMLLGFREDAALPLTLFCTKPFEKIRMVRLTWTSKYKSNFGYSGQTLTATWQYVAASGQVSDSVTWHLNGTYRGGHIQNWHSYHKQEIAFMKHVREVMKDVFHWQVIEWPRKKK